MTYSFSYADALAAIWARSGYDRGFINNPFAGDEAARLGLRRTAALLDGLHRPQQTYGIVHVAGSKGKGSTCAFVSAILVAAGRRTGRFTSPHLHDYRERIAVDGESIAPEAFAALTDQVLAVATAVEREQPELGEVTAFELTTAMALLHFAKVGCDVAVIEVGLGGTLDATNVVEPLVSLITRLDLEHTAILGPTMTAIARNKAGIIKFGRPVLSVTQPEEAAIVIETVAHELESTLSLEGRDWRVEGTWRRFTFSSEAGVMPNLRSGLVGNHQMQNAGIAIAAACRLNADGLQIDLAALPAAVAATTWPGRYEIVDLPRSGVRIVLDGAHTPASALALAQTIAEEEPGRTAVLLAGMLKDKDPGAVAAPLASLSDLVLVAGLDSPRSWPAADLVAALRASEIPAEACAGIPAGIQEAIERVGAGGLVIVTGSLSAVAEARVTLGLVAPETSEGPSTGNRAR